MAINWQAYFFLLKYLILRWLLMKAKFFHFIKNSFNFKEKIKEFSKIEYFKRKKNLIIQKIKKNFKLVFWVSYPFLGGFWVWVWNPKSKPKPNTFWVWMHDVQPIKVPHPNSINKNYDIFISIPSNRFWLDYISFYLDSFTESE